MFVVGAIFVVIVDVAGAVNTNAVLPLVIKRKVFFKMATQNNHVYLAEEYSLINIEG